MCHSCQHTCTWRWMCLRLVGCKLANTQAALFWLLRSDICQHTHQPAAIAPKAIACNSFTLPTIPAVSCLEGLFHQQHLCVHHPIRHYLLVSPDAAPAPLRGAARSLTGQAAAQQAQLHPANAQPSITATKATTTQQAAKILIKEVRYDRNTNNIQQKLSFQSL
eukprot:GHRR01032289.1.p1 GENE.GHRR01032289.1~~GHRR01032289.1.p1  ORF type:complete len:164 (-),score=27.47 GHRR01032289.1:22-513(-)